MFTKEKTNTSEKYNGNSATLISNGTILHGDVKSDNDLRVDGTIYGNVSSSAKIIVGPSGYIEGNIDGQQADITGKVVGNIVVKELLQLKEQGDVQGNINAAKLQIEPTANFNGKCQMGNVANIVQMGGNELQAEAK